MINCNCYVKTEQKDSCEIHLHEDGSHGSCPNNQRTQENKNAINI